MSGNGWKLTLKSLATVAGISFATCLSAQEGKIAPVLSASSYETYEGYEATEEGTEEGAEAGDNYQDASVIDIPSVFEDNSSDVKTVSFHQSACD